jgi:cytochrome P450 family 110
MSTDPSFATDPRFSPLPPGPPGHELAHTWAWMRRPIEIMVESKQRYGRRFTLRFVGNRSFVFLYRPDDVKAAFGASPEALLSGRANKSFIPFFGRHNLMSLDGEQHRRHRRLMMPPFRGEPLASYIPLIERITREAILTWPSDAEFSLHEKMRALTLTVIAQAIFGVRDAPRVEAIRGYVHRMVGGVGARLTYLQFLQRDLGPLSPWGRFLRVRKQLVGVLQKEIDTLRDAGTDRDDVLARLIHGGRSGSDPLSDEELHHELLSLLAAGHETSATALAWAFQYLLPDRDRLARARDEVASMPGEVHPDKLPFLSAIVAETIRLMPPIPIVVRYVAKPVDIAGWSPPIGTFLAPCSYLAHRDPEVFPEPDAFRPERFLDAKPPPWVYFPYGGGARLCLGSTFAHFEMVNILATILRSVDLSLTGPAVARPVRATITIVPSGGTPVRIERRR